MGWESTKTDPTPVIRVPISFKSQDQYKKSLLFHQVRFSKHTSSGAIARDSTENLASRKTDKITVPIERTVSRDVVGDSTKYKPLSDGVLRAKQG
jgi:hypothetical protein